MRRKPFGFSIVLLLAAISGPAAASCEVDRYAELPVTMVDTRPFISGSINGIAANFVADSGAFYSMLSRESAQKFNLQLGPLPRGLYIEGVGGLADARTARANDFSLRGLGATFHNVQFVVGGNAFATGSAGVIGQNVLGRNDTEYDLANGFIRLFHSKGCTNRGMAYWHGSADVATIGIKYASALSPHLLGTATLNGSTIRVLFDTGASHSLLSRKAASHAGFKRDGPDVMAGGVDHGIGDRFIEVWIARFDSLGLGGEEIKNTRLRVGDVDLPGEADMVLGADFFLSHRIYVAESQQRIFFTYNGGRVFDLSVTKKPTDTSASAAEGAAAPVGGEATQQALTDATDLRRRGAASAGRRDFQSAIADFDQAVKLDPTDAETYYRRAMARWHEHQPELAMADFDQALKIKPNDSSILLDRGSFRLQRKDDSGARADFDAIAAIAPRDASLELLVAEAYERAGHFGEAINRLDAWIAANPRDDRMPAALSRRCWSRAAMNNRLDLALADCDAALKHGAASSPFLDSRAIVWLRLGKFDKSIVDFKASLRLQPRSAWALYGLGLAEQKNGMQAQADKDMQTATQITPAIATQFRSLGLAP